MSWALFLVAWLSPALALASGGDDGGAHSVIYNIAVSLVAASALGFVAKLLRQPLLLGYILAGVAIGPIGMAWISDHRDIVTLSEIGLILLLFMIGLEIDLKKMAGAGKLVILPGLLQFPICAGAAYLAFAGLERAGLELGTGSYARLYVAIAISLSSTMIVVKLLFDKLELDTLAGRITVGILVFQDLWAIIVLAVQPNMNDPEVLGLARTFASGALLVGLALAVSRYVLPSVLVRVAQVPELLLVISLGWCFFVALVAAHPAVGLSMEMGALIAGVSLASSPYNLDVVAKAVSIRDFFITLFFVALGMQIPVPDGQVLIVALSIVGVALLVRLVGIFGVLQALASGHRTALLATINLSQVSEFSLVILSLGVGFGHIEQDTLANVIWVFAVLAVVSTYLMTYSHVVQTSASRWLSRLGFADLGRARPDEARAAHHIVVLLGFYRIASALFDELRTTRPHLVQQLKVIDFNPVVKQKLDALGVAHVYGDIGHPDTLHHAGIHHAELLVCSIPDALLRGTTNARLLTTVKGICPKAKVVVTAETISQTRELYAAGADYVLESSNVAGEWLALVVERALLGELPLLQQQARQDLEQREGVLT